MPAPLKRGRGSPGVAGNSLGPPVGGKENHFGSRKSIHAMSMN
jgi:hypothetical protein